MKHFIAICAVFTCLVVTASAQSPLSTDTIRSRVSSAHADDHISVEFDSGGKTTKIMAVSENFEKSEAGRSGILAMNFALGLFYPGDTLVKSPDSFQFTFWVLSKKPRFGASHSLTVTLPEEMLVIGSARYVAKPREQMEYLNFEVSRENLVKIARQTEVHFHLGDQQFTFTKGQMKLLADVLMVTEVN